MFISYIVMRVFWTFLSQNLILGVTYQKLIESRYIGHFLIICQNIDIIIHFLNSSVTLRNYRQNYWYQKLKENYRKIIVIKKFDLTPTPSLNQPCLAFLGLRTTLFEFHEHWSKIWRMSRIQSIRKGQFALKKVKKTKGFSFRAFYKCRYAMQLQCTAHCLDAFKLMQRKWLIYAESMSPESLTTKSPA